MNHGDCTRVLITAHFLIRNPLISICPGGLGGRLSVDPTPRHKQRILKKSNSYMSNTAVGTRVVQWRLE